MPAATCNFGSSKLKLSDYDHSLSSAMASNHANQAVQVSCMVVNGALAYQTLVLLTYPKWEVLSNASVSLSSSLPLNYNSDADDGVNDDDGNR